ncbi:iron complex outermembrane receptor protein [Novosphingobium kunmingense]|uniref:Iron complex outermembrane receptor protein n=1 Tax=Novosphingobium kunmingense TaxID=1211806 RepID=A0A2N0H6P8_9SPHN|nr:TonB-dependent receptor [Novosphingobium kunmingense]PKB14597.1 iron complex outermembrane receptor protein [Novosphingobium kunmingense]
MRVITALLLATTALCAASPALAQDTQSPDTSEDVGIGADIVVTAERREGSLQKTPISITALDETSLANLQVTRTADLQRFTPSLNVAQGTVDPTTLTIFMRGAGQNAGTWVGYESAVGLYIDELYFASLTGANLDLADLERVEVLRGPQGTLYGRNTLTGAIKYVTKKPAANPFGNFEAEYGRFNMVRLKGTVSTPISDDWAILASGNYYRRDGYFNAPALNRDDYGLLKEYGARAAIKYIGSGPFGLTASAFYSNAKNDGSIGLATNATTLAPAASDPYTYLSPVDGYGDAETYGGDLVLSYDIGGSATVKSITGIVHTTEAFLADTSAGRPTNTVNGPYLLGFDRLESTAARTQFSQELQLLGDTLDDRLHYIGGLYVFRETGFQDRTDYLLSIYDLLPQHVEMKTTSYAAYGQLTYDLTPELSAIAGLRYTHEEKSVFGRQQSNLTTVLADRTYGAIDAKRTAKSWTPKFGLNWQATPNVLLYGSVSRGFQAGGFNYLALVSPTNYMRGFDPQTVWAYEVGLKTQFLNRKGRFNLALYRNDFDDIQTNVVINGSALTQNAGTARVEGVEVETSYNPTPGLTIFGTLTYGDDKYLNLNPASSAAAANAKHLPNVPHWQYSFGFNGTIPSETLGDLLLGADYSFMGGKYLGGNNAPITFMPSYELVNAHVGWAPPGLDNFEARFSVSNLLKEKYYVYGNVLGAFGLRSPGEPRTWKISLRYSY